ncbi:hypothetical protein [Pedobacter steynii]
MVIQYSLQKVISVRKNYSWTGYLISGFTIVWIANVYMSLYNLIRIDLKKEKIEAEKEAGTQRSGE